MCANLPTSNWTMLLIATGKIQALLILLGTNVSVCSCTQLSDTFSDPVIKSSNAQTWCRDTTLCHACVLALNEEETWQPSTFHFHWTAGLVLQRALRLQRCLQGRRLASLCQKHQTYLLICVFMQRVIWRHMHGWPLYPDHCDTLRQASKTASNRQCALKSRPSVAECYAEEI